jgi:hypothetical protein
MTTSSAKGLMHHDWVGDVKNFYYTIFAAYQSIDLVYGYEGANECVCMVGIINILIIDLSRGILVRD